MTLRNCLRQRAWRKPINRRSRRELSRIYSYHTTVICLRGDQVRLCAQQRRSPGGEPRFRLGDVGARHLADIEPIAGLLKLLGEDLDVALIELEDRSIAQHVHIGGCRIQQHLLLGDAQRLARGIDLAFGLAGAVAGLKTVEKSLCAGEPHLPRDELIGVNVRRGEHARLLGIAAWRSRNCNRPPP